MSESVSGAMVIGITPEAQSAYDYGVDKGK